ncbi:unnamed protein product, partial [Allacma fusca]
GFVYNHVRREAVVPFLLTVMAGMLIIMPHASNLAGFGVFVSILLVAKGGYVTAELVWIIDIWKERAGPFIQAQHFFHCLGNIFPAIVFASYLRGDKSTDSEVTENPLEFGTNSTASNVTALNSIESKLFVPCAICGSVVFLGAVIQTVMYLVFRNVPDEAEDETALTDLSNSKQIEYHTDVNKESEELGEKIGSSIFTSLNAKNTLLLIALSIALKGAFLTMDMMTKDFLPVFGHFSNLQLSKVEGAHLLISYTSAYAIATILGIILNTKISSLFILYGNIVFIIVGNIFFFLAVNNHEDLVWVSSVLLGVGFSTSIPSIFAFVQLHIDVTNIVGATLLVASAIFAGIFRLIVGGFIEKVPTIFLYLNLGLVMFGILVLMCFLSVVSRNK